MIEILLFITTFTYYVTIAATEGWKWRMDLKKEDNHPWITYHNYHAWRAVTNLSLIVATIGFLIPDGLGFNWRTGLFLLLINIGSWLSYERCMSYVQEDNWEAKRADFHILGKVFPRPNPVVEITVGAIALIGAFVILHFI